MKYSGTFLTLFLCLALLVTAAFGAQVIDDTVAEVGAFSGKVFIVRDGERFHVSEGTKLRVGDRIVTDSAGTVKLHHRDGSTMYIGTSSSLIIMAPMKLSLIEGTIKADTMAALEIDTQDGRNVTAPIEGAGFIVRQSAEGIEVMALSNNVHMGRTKVAPGMYAIAGKGQAPTFRIVPDFEAAEMFADVGGGSDRAIAEEVAPLGFSPAAGRQGSGTPTPKALPAVGND